MILLQYCSTPVYWLIFAIALLEALAIIGLIIPRLTIVVVSGLLFAQGAVDIIPAIWFAALGAIIGDSVSFYLGKRGLNIFAEDNRLFKLRYVHKGEALYRKYGRNSIFWARWFGVTRAIIPSIAGMFKMRSSVFFLYNIIGAIVWAIFYISFGYICGILWLLIETWSTRTTLLGVLALAGVVGLYLLRHTVLRQGKRAWFIFKSVWQSTVKAVRTNPDIQTLAQHHPRFFRFWQHRFNRTEFSGLPATVLVVAFGYVFITFFGVVKNIITSDFVTASDVSLANLLYVFRTPLAVQVNLWITLLGKLEVVLAIVISISLLLWLWDRKHYLFAFWITLGGSALFTMVSKLIFQRPRPIGLGVYLEPSFSFPSGHATIAMTLYGFIIYFVWRTEKYWRKKLNALFLGGGIIIVVSFSRLYLGVHYLSDVIGGLLLGILWLIIGISLREWLGYKYRLTPRVLLSRRRLSNTTKVIMICIIVWYVLYGLQYEPLVASYETQFVPTLVSTDVITTFSEQSLPRYTETIRGVAQEPPSFIIIAQNDTALTLALQQAGWSLADPVTIRSLALTWQRIVLNQPDPNAPVTPVFWNNRVNDFGFQKSTDSNTVRQRHHARFWKTNIQTPTGWQVYIGTASFDQGIKWGGVTHAIDPAVDTEREVLFTDLHNADVIAQVNKTPFVKPTLGTNFVGDQFFTDGETYVITLK